MIFPIRSNHNRIPANLQSGNAPANQSFAHVLTALKRAEDGNGLVLRLVEMNGQGTEALVELDPSVTDGLTVATCLDLMERPVEGKVAWQNGTLTVGVPALDFVTVRLSKKQDNSLLPTQ